jgi:uncharacterized membrane protein YdjX (TVP38/TMEM64 family)
VEVKKKRKIQFFFGLIIVLIIAALYLLLRKKLFADLSQENLKAFISSFGVYAPLIYIVVLAISVVVSQIPNIPLAICAGMMFGTNLGGLYSVIGGMVGALACFYIARSVGVTFIKKLFGRVPVLSDRIDETNVGLIIFVARLFPFFSFDIISYCAGLTNIRMRTFFIATITGMVPMTLLFTHLGDNFMLDKTLYLFFNLCVVLVFFLAPFLVRRFNFFGLKKYISFE